jgi:hypothetical protein
MSCHAMHPMQDLFLESFSQVLLFDMHFYMHSYLHKIFILVKSGCYNELRVCYDTETEFPAGLTWVKENSLSGVRSPV